MDTKTAAPLGVYSINTTLISAWFGATFTTLILSLLLVFHLSTPMVVKQQGQSFNLYAALPDTSTQVSESIEDSDARAKIIENFFKGYNSPLSKFGEAFVKTADKYKLDYRLLPSIAMQESNGGRKLISDSFNPFGYGIYSSQVKRFTSFEEAIDRVGRGLREDYLDKGLTTAEKIMPKYTPPSVALGGPWAKGVSTFMEELR